MFPTDSLPRAVDGFDLLECLGVGAAGEVYLARSRGGKLVAIKTIVRAESGDERSADTFLREASVCARLHHPCIVQMRAFLDQPGFAALVFEYVPGVALARVLRFAESQGVRLPDRAAWHVVERVLTALAYAHAFHGEEGRPNPIVHRDLSPSNVLIDWGGNVKIADYGIAKVLGVSPATRFGLVKGTLGCMAPEQARGEPVDERADVYAAALLAWRLATGRVPFAKHQDDEFELLRAMRNPRIHPLAVIRPDLSAPLLDAMARALEADPERRTIDAAELAAVVRAEMEVDAGAKDLAVLLERWKPAIERTVKRGRPVEPEAPRRKLDRTMRYEDAALAFDEEELSEEATYEAHALPTTLDARDIAKAPRSIEGIADGDAPDPAQPALAPSSALPPARVAEPLETKFWARPVPRALFLLALAILAAVVIGARLTLHAR
jgi:serine/threonine protein kinase